MMLEKIVKMIEVLYWVLLEEIIDAWHPSIIAISCINKMRVKQIIIDMLLIQIESDSGSIQTILQEIHKDIIQHKSAFLKIFLNI